jgi:Zn-dependent protease with chaperone function
MKNEIKNNHLQELDPVLTGTIVVGTIMTVSNVISLISAASALKNNIKVDSKLTKEINDLMDTKDEWIVHVYKTGTPNAFSLGFGRHIFITSGLLKLLSRDEVYAVLLHECWHSKSKHTFKHLAVKYPLFYLSSYVALSLGFLIGFPFAALVCLLLLNNISDILLAVTMGRRYEYDADSFAAKMGYGPHLINALKKIKVWSGKVTRQQHCGAVCQIAGKISEAIDEHPSDKKRFEKILKKSEEIKKSLSFKSIKNFVVKNWR